MGDLSRAAIEPEALLGLIQGEGLVRTLERGILSPFEEDVVQLLCTFSVSLNAGVSRSQWGTLRVWEPSARDGSPVNVREYPVWLTP